MLSVGIDKCEDASTLGAFVRQIMHGIAITDVYAMSCCGKCKGQERAWDTVKL